MAGEIRALLDKELLGLTEIYRTAIILCDVQGKTRKEAARLVGCPEGTLSTRLLRARALLAKRLVRKGVTLSIGALTAALARQEAWAVVPSTLVSATMRAAASLALDQATVLVSPSAAALAKGVLQGMFWAQLMKSATLAVTAGLLCAGLALSFHHGPEVATSAPESLSQQEAAVPPKRPSDPAQQAIWEKLKRPVALEKGIEGNTKLQDALDFLRDRYDLKIAIDSKRFETLNRLVNVGEQPISLPVLAWVRLQDVFQLLAKQVKGTCFISEGQVWLVPEDETLGKELIAKGYAPLPAPSPDIELQSKVFMLIDETQERTARQLRSGSGTGSYEDTLQYPGQPERTRRMQAKFTLHFDHKRYYLRLHEDARDMSGSTTFISDNSAVFIASTSKSRQLGEVYPLGHDEEFPWRLWQIARAPFDLGEWGRQPVDVVRVEELPERGYTLHLQQGKLYLSWTVLERFGWHISSYKFDLDGRRTMSNQAQIIWKKTGDIWHVVDIKQTTGYRHYSLHFDDFKPNAEISSQLFRLAALELPVGAPIHDQRDWRHEVRYTYKPIPKDRAHRFFDMEAELESLPVR